MGGDGVRGLIAVELIQTEPTHWEGSGWTGQVITDALGRHAHPSGEDVIELGWYPRLGALLEEARDVVETLRAWLPELAVEVTLNGSAGAAKVAARRAGVSLPR